MTQPTDLGTVYPLDQVRAVADVARAPRAARAPRRGPDRQRPRRPRLLAGRPHVARRRRRDLARARRRTARSARTPSSASTRRCGTRSTYRLKRAGHVASKMRFQSAQLDAYLTDGLWLRLAATANAGMARLAAGLASMGIAPDHGPTPTWRSSASTPAVIDAWQDGRARLLPDGQGPGAPGDELPLDARRGRRGAAAHGRGAGGEPPASAVTPPG